MTAVPAGDGPTINLPSIGPDGIDNQGNPSPSGRVQDIEADPFVAHRYLALSDAALWQSTDSGATWTKLTGLDRFGEWQFEHGSIAFDPLVRGVVLMTAPLDRQSPTQIGVYRSTDGGQIWQSAINYRPHCDGGGIGNPSVVTFHGHHAIVGGGCTVGTSTDDGQNWTWSAPDSGGGFNGVTFDTSGNEFACGTDGIFEQASGTWSKVVDFTAAPWSDGQPIAYFPDFGTCRITASPAQPNHVFFAARWSDLTLNPNDSSDTFSDVGEAYLNSDHLWSVADLVGSGHDNGRDVGVQTRPRASGGFYLYWGTDDQTQFQTCTAAIDQECTAGTTHDETQSDPPWTFLGQGADPHGLHADQTKIIFSPTAPYCILLVSDDGGIQKPDSGNCNGTQREWTYTDRGISGVEFYEVTGTTIVGAGHPETDLYGASQDNDAYVKLDGYSNWKHVPLSGDSFLVDATAEVRTTQLSSITTFANSDGVQYIGRRGLTDLSSPSDTNTLFNSPCTGLQSPHQIDETIAGKVAMLCIDSDGTRAEIYTSTDHGQTWTLEPSSTVIGHVGDHSGASLYTTRTASGANAYIVRIAGELWYVVPSTTRVNRMPDAWDVGPVAVASDGSRILTFACPPAPATCGADGTIRIWNRNTGEWTDSPVATSMLTSDRYNNTYPLDTNLATDGEASSVAIAPHDPNLMAIATLDVGVLVSGDGGNSWQRVPMAVGNINKAWFDNTDRLYLGTYGRGMFGGTVPDPDQLHLTATRSVTISGQQHWTWSAHLETASGDPVTNAPIRFTLKNDATGEETEVGYGTTGADGIAHGGRDIPPGTYHLIARWQPRNGGDVATETSIVAQPSIHVVGPGQLVQTGSQYVLHYSGQDPGQKDPLHYDIRERTASGTGDLGKYQLPPKWQDTSATTQTVTLTPGQTTCLSVRSINDLKQTSPWTPDHCVIAPIDDTRLTTATTGWQRLRAKRAYQGTITSGGKKGLKLNLGTVKANGVALIVTTCPRCGSVSVLVNGHRVATQTTHSDATAYETVLPWAAFKAQQARVSIETTTSLPVQIDGVAVRRPSG